MINGVHTMFYSDEAEALRAFLRDTLGFEADDVGGGWLIMRLPPAEMGCHPTDHEGSPPSGTAQISFMCDDIQATMSELMARGVTFLSGVEDHGYGLATAFEAPGGLKLELYQPAYSGGVAQTQE